MFVMVKFIGCIYSIVGPFDNERAALDWLSSNIDTDDWKYWTRYPFTRPDAYVE